jgi:membrane-associated phospholipid phosphatase
MLAADKLFIGYMGLSGLFALVMGGADGAVLAVLHAVAIGGVLLWSRRPVPKGGFLRFLRVAYPVALTPLLYSELASLNQFLVTGYLDEMVQGWEMALFGTQLSIEASNWFPAFGLSEWFHLGYVSYYLIVPAAMIGVYLTRGAAALHRTIFTIALAFFVCYVIFIVLPVAGPRYYFEQISGTLSEGSIFGVVHLILESGSSKGTAFPSSHIAATASAVFAAGREDRRLFWWLVVPMVGLSIGTVYGRFHYGVDALAGALIAILAWAVTPWLVAKLKGEPAEG